MTRDNSLKPTPPQLPDTIDDWERKVVKDLTLNDHVEAIHRKLANVQRYKDYLYATYDEQAVEGSTSADNHFAAIMIREQADAMGNEEVKRQKIATLSKALGVVLRRYGQSRKERRLMVGGEMTGSGENNND